MGTSRTDIASEQTRTAAADAIAEYQRPEVVDFGTLTELTLSGSMPLSDSFGGSAGGGS